MKPYLAFRTAMLAVMLLHTVNTACAQPLIHSEESNATAGLSQLPQLRQFEETLQTAIQTASPAVVAITIFTDPLNSQHDPFAALTAEPTNRLPAAVGLGVIVRHTAEATFLLTHAKLVDKLRPATDDKPLAAERTSGARASRLSTTATSLEPASNTSQAFIRLAGGKTQSATLFSSDPRSELAILKTAIIRQIAPIPMGTAESLQRGSLLLMLANPYAIARNGECSVTLGMLSHRSRRPLVSSQTPVGDDDRIHAMGTLLEIDAHVALSSTGGTVVNQAGELVGLITGLGILPPAETLSTLAIPMNAGFRRVVQSLLSGYEVDYGFLGLTPEDTLPADMESLRPAITQDSAARVNRVARNSPADQAGIQTGDIILSVDGNPVFNQSDFMREIALSGAGNQAELHVWREAARQLTTLTVRLGKWPVYDDTQIVAPHTRVPVWRGVRVDFPTSRRRFLADRFLVEYPAGVVVLEVEANSPAAVAGLKVGQFIVKVNDLEISTPDEFASALDAIPSDAVGQLILADGSHIEITP